MIFDKVTTPIRAFYLFDKHEGSNILRIKLLIDVAFEPLFETETDKLTQLLKQHDQLTQSNNLLNTEHGKIHVIPVTKEDVTFTFIYILQHHFIEHDAAQIHRFVEKEIFHFAPHIIKPDPAATQQAAKNVEYILKDQCLKLQSIHQNHLTADTAQIVSERFALLDKSLMGVVSISAICGLLIYLVFIF